MATNKNIKGTIRKWNHIIHKSWEDAPIESCETFFATITEKTQTLEWVPFYDPDDDTETPQRKMIDDPIIFQNIFPGGIRLPYNHQAALNEMESRLGLESKNALRCNINYWKALQNLHRQCGWPDTFDTETFEKRRKEWLKTMKEIEKISGVYGLQWGQFLAESAGEDAV